MRIDVSSVLTSDVNIKMKRGKSFTLIELLVVIAIIALLSSIVLVALKGAREKAQIAKTLEWARSVKAQLGGDIVGDWNFNEGQGTTAYDATGYNNGTLGNGACSACQAGAPCPCWTDGVQGLTGKALYFDGVDDYVQVTDPPSLRVQTHTVEFWIKFNSIAAGVWRPVLQKWGAGSDRAPGIWRHTTYPQRLHWRYNPGNLGFGNVGPGGEGTDFNVNEWYHIVGVKEGTVLKLYVSGKYVATATVPDPITQGTGNFRLGASANAPAVILDEVRIYNRALTAMEIQKHYAAGLPHHQLAERYSKPDVE